MAHGTKKDADRGGQFPVLGPKKMYEIADELANDALTVGLNFYRLSVGCVPLPNFSGMGEDLT